MTWIKRNKFIEFYVLMKPKNILVTLKYHEFNACSFLFWDFHFRLWSVLRLRAFTQSKTRINTCEAFRNKHTRKKREKQWITNHKEMPFVCSNDLHSAEFSFHHFFVIMLNGLTIIWLWTWKNTQGAMPSTSGPTPSPLACGSSQCRYLDEYCDAYESACHHCSKLCSTSEKFHECVELCNPYVKNILFSSDVRRVTIHKERSPYRSKFCFLLTINRLLFFRMPTSRPQKSLDFKFN